MTNNNIMIITGRANPLSRLYRCKFTVNEITFTSLEQYILFNKALLFDDLKTAHMILKTNDTYIQKTMSKRIRNYHHKIWHKEMRRIAFDGTEYKFKDKKNKHLRDMLINTAPNTLAEACPYDRDWGIGLSINDPSIYHKNKWRGDNIYGQVLMDVRNII